MSEHLAALQVVVPLLAAPACILLRREEWVRVFAVGVTWACFAMSISRGYVHSIDATCAKIWRPLQPFS